MLREGKNATYLSAIGAGYLDRNPPEFSSWLELLERHALVPEDPFSWSKLIILCLHDLLQCDSERIGKLVEIIFERFPEAFDNLNMGYSIWKLRDSIDEVTLSSIINYWRLHPDHKFRQLSGELATIIHLIDDSSDCIENIYLELLYSDDVYNRCGVLFAASLMWKDNREDIRNKSHSTLLEYVSTCNHFEAHSIAWGINIRDYEFPSDNISYALLEAIRDNRTLLEGFVDGAFIVKLQYLIDYPRFAEVILQITEKIIEIALDPINKGNTTNNRDSYLHDGELVALSVTLQNPRHQQRSRALTMYERLLDADNYYATDAAKSSLRESI